MSEGGPAGGPGAYGGGTPDGLAADHGGAPGAAQEGRAPGRVRYRWWHGGQLARAGGLANSCSATLAHRSAP